MIFLLIILFFSMLCLINVNMSEYVTSLKGFCSIKKFETKYPDAGVERTNHSSGVRPEFTLNW